MHPGGEFAGQLFQRRFGARDRVLVAVVGERDIALRSACGGVITSWSA
jgi:hypothetical protein